MKASEDWKTSFMGNVIVGLFALLCIIPLILLVIASFTDEFTINKNGYSFLPAKLSFTAYKYLWWQSATIGRACMISIIITIIGTISSLTITSMLAYGLSRKDLPYRNIINAYVVFTMLFHGGMVSTYLVYTQYLHMKNTIWALLIPTLLLNGFTVMLGRTYFASNIPQSVIESANIDGAGELKIFVSIILPMSMPVMATIGLLTGLAYWNDWFNGLIYLTDPKLFSLQNVLNRIMIDIQFLQTTNLGNITEVSGKNLPIETIRMAMAVIGVVPIIFVYALFQKYFVKGITLGAVKG